MTKPVFDIYAFRTVRGDALAKYNVLNQSEPLRINLFALISLVALAFPSLAPEVTPDQSSLSLPQTALCGIAAVGAAALFVRECQRRNRQLTRLEKELAASLLTLQLPATSALGEALFQSSTVTMKQAQAQQTLRILAVSGNRSQLQQALPQLQVLGQRLKQSNTIVVPVPTDNSQYTEWNLNPTALQSQVGWLAAPGNVRAWQEYFASLVKNNNQNNNNDLGDSPSSLQWFGFSAVGRSFGSGSSLPSWLQLMGQHLRPTVLVDADVDEPLELVAYKNSDDIASSSPTSTSAQETAVLQQLSAFYHALTTGDLQAMEEDIFYHSPDSGLATSAQVTSIIAQGGRLDPWSTCLQDGNRPDGMQVANADVTLFLENDVAYSTVVEFPDPNLIAGGDAGTPSLLAVQQWIRIPSASNNSSDKTCEWKLVEHQTIPWSDAVPAAGTLVCDGRGCVSLVRSG